MNKREQMLEILKDTRDYYKEDPDNRRSIDDDGNCNYTWGENHCAVGRYLKPEFQREQWSSNNDSVNQLCEEYEDASAYGIDWVLRDEVHGIDVDFWMQLQDFHDNRHNWITKKTASGTQLPGISDDGKCEYVAIEDKITGGSYD
tara:strand:- start:4736 stop:5170 length:435 start_codon:yes stop_codon:yes gene_type:complete